MDGCAALSSSDAGARPELRTPTGFADWVAPHWTAMSRLAARLNQAGDPDDIVQDALTTAWRRRDRFDPTRGTARNWLLAITADQARKARHRTARQVTGQLVDESVAPAPAATSTVDMDLDIERALRQLTHRQQTAISLYYYLGLPVAEVADVLGCAEGTVKSTLFDARARLRRLLGEDFP